MHPIAVATILARMQLDAETIAAALLHDVIEDTPVTLERAESKFGDRVAKLVDGVTKLGRIPWTADDGEGAGSREKAQQARTCARCSSPWSTTSASFSSSWPTGCTTCAPSTPCRRRSRPHRPADAGDLRATGEQTRHLAVQIRARGPRLSVINPEAYHALTREFEKRARDSAPYIEEVKTSFWMRCGRRDRSRDHRPHQAHLLDLPQDAARAGRSTRSMT